MNYFEFVEPYYALIKANYGEEAVKEYIEVVAGDESDFESLHEECKLVPQDYALVRFSQAPGENRKLVDPHSILEDFNKPEVRVLIMDGSLL